MIRLGIDGGSTFCKVVLLDEDDNILDKRMTNTGWQPAVTARTLAENVLESAGISRSQCRIVSTGYSRESIDFADEALTEISAHARGAVYLSPQVAGVVDIGGQDSKVIKIINGRVMDFMMNDKCAAGTGRFVEMAMRTLECQANEVDELCDLDDAARINSMCTVFAESEIIGLIAKGTHRGQILGGVMNSIASRISQMLTRVTMPRDGELLMTGGLSSFDSLVHAISEKSGRKIHSNPDSIYAGALGAALLAK